MYHHTLLSLRDTPDPCDTHPTCTGLLRYLGQGDIGDADWDCFQCEVCGQYLWTAGTPGDTWNGIVPASTIDHLRERGRLWMPGTGGC